MPGRQFVSSSTYRYGFNGKENDNEVKGVNGSSVDFGERIFDTRLARFLTLDPLIKDYPENSPYLYANNCPVDEIDVDGEEGGAVSVASAKAFSEYHSTVTREDSWAGSLMLDFIPVVGTIKGVIEAFAGEDMQGNKLSDIDRVMNIIPFIGAIKKVVKAEKVVVNVNKIQKISNKVENVGGLCFVKGTLILTNKGLLPIENIIIGDSVWAYNDSLHIINKQVVNNTVIKQTTKLIVFKIGHDVIYTTPDHPFYIDNNWVKAENVNQGDSVLLFNGFKTNISYKTLKDTSCEVYNFAVSNYHTYYVSKQSVLVHNNNPCATTKNVKLKTSSSGKFTEPNLPNKTIVNENGVKVEHYYKSGDHAPPHMHVKGGGANTKIGANGKPIKGSSELSPLQSAVINANKSKIRSAGNKISDYQKFQGYLNTK